MTKIWLRSFPPIYPPSHPRSSQTLGPLLLRYGRFQTDSTTPSHRLGSTGGFRRLASRSIVLLLFLQKQNLATAIYLFGLGDILGLRPPQGEKWVGHSHRSGGATSALSIDDSLPVIARFGVWDHMDSLQAYLDASVGPSADALLFFEHLLKPSLTAVRAQLSVQRAQAQGLPRTYSSVLLRTA